MISGPSSIPKTLDTTYFKDFCFTNADYITTYKIIVIYF